MALSKNEVKHLAELSRLEIDASEENMLLKNFNDILNHVKKIQNVDTEGVEPCSNVFTLYNVLRDDEVMPSYTPEKLLSNAPSKEDSAYLVPKVVE